MSIFHFGKKKNNPQPSSCCCGGNEPVPQSGCCCDGQTVPHTSCCCGQPVSGICCIKVLGAGCRSCQDLLIATKAAARNIGLTIEIEYVTDMAQITAYGVMTMPALVVNEQVVSCGKVLKASEAEAILRKMGTRE